MKKKIILYAGIVVGLLVLAYAYVPQVLAGKIVNQSDISGYVGMSHEMKEFNAAHPDDPTLWTDAMFGGMPVTAWTFRSPLPIQSVEPARLPASSRASPFCNLTLIPPIRNS